MTLYMLPFEAFLDAVKKRDLAECMDLYGSSSPEEYNEIKTWYEIYCQIGGYPAGVKK